jgi:hypothetical protein
VVAVPNETVSSRTSGLQADGVPETAPRAQLVERLRGEFGDRVALDDIRTAVDHAFASLSGARVRTFVSVLAWRRARSYLRRSAPTDGVDVPA